MICGTEHMVKAARSCLGTPFHHQGRLPGVGLDCIGLVIVALRAAGVTVWDRQDYGKMPEPLALAQALAAHGARRVMEMQAGDVLLFAMMGAPRHVALCSGAGQMIHSYALAGRVVETRFDKVWQRRLSAIYRFDSAEA